MRRILNLFVLTGLFAALPMQVLAKPWAHIELSKYYALPGEQVSVFGMDYEAGEHISVYMFNTTHHTTADGNGRFVSSGITVPFTFISTTTGVSSMGTVSGTQSARIVVGTFYPHVEPYRYFLTLGSTVTFIGRDFAPHEQIVAYKAGQEIGRTTASGAGGFSMNLPGSSTAGKYTYSFMGVSSQTRSQVVVEFAKSVTLSTVTVGNKVLGKKVLKKSAKIVKASKK